MDRFTGNMWPLISIYPLITSSTMPASNNPTFSLTDYGDGGQTIPIRGSKHDLNSTTNKEQAPTSNSNNAPSRALAQSSQSTSTPAQSITGGYVKPNFPDGPDDSVTSITYQYLFANNPTQTEAEKQKFVSDTVGPEGLLSVLRPEYDPSQADVFKSIQSLNAGVSGLDGKHLRGYCVEVSFQASQDHPHGSCTSTVYLQDGEGGQVKAEFKFDGSPMQAWARMGASIV
jgi:hypothetical protein